MTTRAVRCRFPHIRRLQKAASLGKRVGFLSLHAVSSWPSSLCCCGFNAAGFCFFLHFLSNAHGLLHVSGLRHLAPDILSAVDTGKFPGVNCVWFLKENNK